jgi:hypothetical protein
MEIVKCANCQTTVVPSPEGICPSCNHDASTFAMDGNVVEKRVVGHRKDLRNSVWLLAVIAFVPTLVFFVGRIIGPGDRMSGFGIVLLAYSISLTVIGFVSGILCERGHAFGVPTAYLATVLLLVGAAVWIAFEVLSSSRLPPVVPLLVCLGVSMFVWSKLRYSY